MAKDSTTKDSTTTAADATAPARVGFEVVGTLNMGRKDGALDVRTSGDTVYADELDAKMIEHLLSRGEIADRNAPIPPSMAEKVVAFEHLLDVARQIGAVVINGAEISVAGDETVYRGLSELRKVLSIDALKKAIVEAAK